VDFSTLLFDFRIANMLMNLLAWALRRRVGLSERVANQLPVSGLAAFNVSIAVPSLYCATTATFGVLERYDDMLSNAYFLRPLETVFRSQSEKNEESAFCCKCGRI